MLDESCTNHIPCLCAGKPDQLERVRASIGGFAVQPMNTIPKTVSGGRQSSWGRAQGYHCCCTVCSCCEYIPSGPLESPMTFIERHWSIFLAGGFLEYKEWFAWLHKWRSESWEIVLICMTQLSSCLLKRGVEASNITALGQNQRLTKPYFPSFMILHKITLTGLDIGWRSVRFLLFVGKGCGLVGYRS